MSWITPSLLRDGCHKEVTWSCTCWTCFRCSVGCPAETPSWPLPSHSQSHPIYLCSIILKTGLSPVSACSLSGSQIQTRLSVQPGNHLGSPEILGVQWLSYCLGTTTSVGLHWIQRRHRVLLGTTAGFLANLSAGKQLYRSRVVH